MGMRRFVSSVLIFVTISSSMGLGFVLAEQEDPNWPPPEGAACKRTKQDIEEAQTLFKLGNRAYNTANYADAIKYWRDSYKRDCTAHLLLKNLGRAYEADTQYSRAIEAYKLYSLRAKIVGEDREIIDTKIANLSKRIVASSTTNSTSVSVSTEITPSPITSNSNTTTTEIVTSIEPPPPVSSSSVNSTTIPFIPVKAKPQEPESSSVAPWVVMGVSGAVMIGGIVLWGVENNIISNKSKEFTDPNLRCTEPLPPGARRTTCESIANDGKSAEKLRTVGIVLSSVGLVGTGVGLVWGLLSGPSSAKSTTSLRLGPGPGWAGLSLSGTF